VLFIDELTNVKPTVQSLVYSIVLDHAGKDGLWQLPDNAVVVAAGNETADSSVANNLPGALHRRFCHIYYQIDKQAWLDWAMGVSKVKKQKYEPSKKEDRAKIHPAILTYIMSRGDDILNQDLDEENPKIVTDPRKWEIASNVLYETKNPKALVPAIGEDLTADFTFFVQSIPVSVNDVINGEYSKRDFAEMAIDRKMSTVLGLLPAKEEHLTTVRAFIKDNLGKELLATYDSLWIRNDPERAQIIAENSLENIEENING
jgi:Fe-S cluster biosynthesis and repair protein YggX